MPPNEPTAALQTVYLFVCPRCETENLVRPGVVEFLTLEDREEAFRQFHDLESWQDLPDEWESWQPVYVPQRVRCSHCKAAFRSQLD